MSNKNKWQREIARAKANLKPGEYLGLTMTLRYSNGREYSVTTIGASAGPTILRPEASASGCTPWPTKEL